MLQIQNAQPRPTSPHPIFNLGFRIFFVGASVFAILSMLLWLLILQGVAPFNNTLSPFYWHAHEMIFGYGLAVVAGFLLTAVKTWTNQPMPYGVKLMPIFGAWAMARLLWLGLHAVPSGAMMTVAFVFDMLFWGLVLFWVVKAVWAVRQKRQLGIVVALMVLLLAQVGFVWAVLAKLPDLQKSLLYLAFYTVIALIFIIGRRVLPFFIEKGIQMDNQGKPTGLTYTQKNNEILDKIINGSLVLFIVNELTFNHQIIMVVLAIIITLGNGVRLKNWYHHAIWQKPLLWSLYGSFIGLVVGFLLMAVLPFVEIANGKSLALHLLAVSGFGLTILAMMCRVSLGHTGRNIHLLPKGVPLIFVLIILVLIFRSVLPLFFNQFYNVWLLLSQIAWIMAFVLFFMIYVKILASERADGLFG